MATNFGLPNWRRFASDAGGYTGQGGLYDPELEQQIASQGPPPPVQPLMMQPQLQPPVPSPQEQALDARRQGIPQAPQARVPVQAVPPPQAQELPPAPIAMAPHGLTAPPEQDFPDGTPRPRLDAATSEPIRVAQEALNGLPQAPSAETQAMAAHRPSGLRMGLAALASTFTPSQAFAPLIAYGPKGLAARQEVSKYESTMPLRLQAGEAIQRAYTDDENVALREETAKGRRDQNKAVNEQKGVDAYNRVTASLRTRHAHQIGEQDGADDGYTVETVSTPDGRQERWAVPSPGEVKRQEFIATTDETPQDILEAYPDSPKRMTSTAIQGVRSALQRKDDAAAQRALAEQLQAERIAMQKTIADSANATRTEIAQLKKAGTGSNLPEVEIKPDSRQYRLAQDIAYGKLTMAQFRNLYAYGKNTEEKLAIYDLAGRMNHNFNPAQFEMGFTLAKNPKVQQQLASMDNVERGVDDLLKISDAASRTGIPLLNKAVVKGGYMLGGKAYSNLATARTAFADELSGALGFGGATDMQREMGLDLTDPSVSPAVFRDNIQKVVVPFIQRKRNTLLDQMGVYGQEGMNPAAGGGGGGRGNPSPQTPPASMILNGKTLTLGSDGKYR